MAKMREGVSLTAYSYRKMRGRQKNPAPCGSPGLILKLLETITAEQPLPSVFYHREGVCLPDHPSHLLRERLFSPLR